MRFDLTRLSLATKILLVGAVLLFIDLFLDWAHKSAGPISIGNSGWHGIGVLLGLLTIALILWESFLAFAQADLRSRVPENIPTTLVSVGLAAAVALFAIIDFLMRGKVSAGGVSVGGARSWPAWVGLILGIIIAVGGFLKFGESPATAPTSPTTPPPAPPPAPPA
jgi:hypothetical protein